MDVVASGAVDCCVTGYSKNFDCFYSAISVECSSEVTFGQRDQLGTQVGRSFAVGCTAVAGVKVTARVAATEASSLIDTQDQRVEGYTDW